jgi:predicted ATPase
VGLSEVAPGADEGFWAVRTLFEALARRRPLVIVFDDIHWAEPTFLDLVEHIADWTPEVPLLLLCIARPELLDVRPAWGGGKLNATALLLEPLSADESRKLIDNLAGVELDAAARARILDAAEGNPLFVEEMLALAREHADKDRELEVPRTIQALLAARLDALHEDERTVLERAAVEGNVFHQGSVIELCGEELRGRVGTSISALIRKQLVRSERAVFTGERGFRFRHLLIRDAAYDSLPKEARAALHEQHAEWLAAKAADRSSEYEEILGYHFEQAARYRSELDPHEARAPGLGRLAAERLGPAGRRAFARNDLPAAVKLISRAAALLPGDDPARLDLIPSVRVVQGMSADLASTDSILKSALETNDERLKAHALVQHGFLRLFTEPGVGPEDLIDIAVRANATFERVADDLGLARGYRLIGQAHYLARSALRSAEASERALTHARRTRDSFEIKEIVEWLAIALTLGPTHRRRAGTLSGSARRDRRRPLSRSDPAVNVCLSGGDHRQA